MWELGSKGKTVRSKDKREGRILEEGIQQFSLDSGPLGREEADP